MTEGMANQGDVTQDDIFKLSVPGKRLSDYANLGTPIYFLEDEKHLTEDVKKVDILDFGEEGFLLNSLLTTEECHNIINEGEKIGFKPIEGSLDYRSSQRILLRCPELSSLLFSRTLPYLKDICIDGEPKIQHIQGIEAALKGTWTPNGLNEDDCGQYRAEEQNILCRLQPLEGQAIIFNHHRLHEGGKLLDGVKYILRSDLMYKRSGGPTFTEAQEKAMLLFQDAERYEESKEGDKAADCYRRAFKLWPALEDSV